MFRDVNIKTQGNNKKEMLVSIMWIGAKDSYGQERLMYVSGITRNGQVLVYWNSDGERIGDSGYNYTEEEAIKIYNKIIEIINPIDFNELIKN